MFASGKAASVSAEANYIEDVFSTYLYTGNGSTQTITNGIDLSGKGGLVWRQGRSAATGGMLIDTARGIGSYLISYSTDAAQTGSNWIDSFNSNGFTMNSSSFNGGATYASWTFRKQAKFFDVVTYTGNGTNGRTVAHSLGSTPGCIIVKRTDAANGWAVYHRAMNASPQDYMMRLNATDGAFTLSPSRWNNTLPTSTEFTLSGNDEVNGSGATYVAYLFAHNAGGFGLTGTDNVISCGSFTTNSSGAATISLGYEPQWVMIKSTSTTGDWILLDTMRGFSVTGGSGYNALEANLTSAEFSGSSTYFQLTNTGFSLSLNFAGWTNENFVYIAIRRGPMKVPTDATKVFSPYTATLSAGTTVNAGLTPDLLIGKYRSGTDNPRWVDRLRGFANATGGTNPELYSNETSAEASSTAWSYNWNNTGYVIGNALNGLNSVIYSLRRAPSFFDEVCYTGDGASSQTVTHNLGVAPELYICKRRNGISSFEVWCRKDSTNAIYSLALQSTGAGITSSSVSGYATSTTIQVGDQIASNTSGGTYVAYLFATCAGVSKCTTFTGNGTSQTINCGFTSGARFVMIKATSTTGSWWTFDSARGIVTNNDPALQLNSSAAEVTSADAIDTASSGFIVNQEATCSLNASGVTYLVWAIA